MGVFYLLHIRDWPYKTNQQIPIEQKANALTEILSNSAYTIADDFYTNIDNSDIDNNYHADDKNNTNNHKIESKTPKYLCTDSLTVRANIWEKEIPKTVMNEYLNINDFLWNRRS